MSPRHLFTPLLLVLACLCASCGAPEAEPATDPAPSSEQTTTPEQTTTAIPEIDFDAYPEQSYLAPTELVSYYGGEPRDTLQVAEDYGRLYPFVGQVLTEGHTQQEYLYGLADAQGRIVLEPLYAQASYLYDPDGNPAYLHLAHPAPTRAEAEQMAEPQEYRFHYVSTTHQFISVDGTWLSPVFAGHSASLSAGRVIVSQLLDPAGKAHYSNLSYELYDLEGNLLAEGLGMLGDFSEGLAIVTSTECIGEQDYNRYRYIDTAGQVVLPGPYACASDFHEGLAWVAPAEGEREPGRDWLEYPTYGLIDQAGNYLIEPTYHMDSSYGIYPYVTVKETVKEEEKYALLDWQGQRLLPDTYDIINTRHNALPDYVVTQELTNGEYTWTLRRLSDEQAWTHPDNHLRLLQEQADGRICAVVGRSGSPGAATLSVELWDAEPAEVRLRMLNCDFAEALPGGLYLFGSYDWWHWLALDEDLQPFFPEQVQEEAGAALWRRLCYLADDVYQVRTEEITGLIRADGTWLLRLLLPEPVGLYTQ